MAGTKRQTSESVLKKLIKHWPGYIILGSKPYDKGAKIYKEGKEKFDFVTELVQEFPSNDAAFLTMSESIIRNNGWFPGKDINTPLFNEIKNDEFVAKEQIKQAQNAFYNNARKARDLRNEADVVFSFINVDPLDKNWVREINKILNVRRKK